MFSALAPKAALTAARRKGRAAEYRYLNDDNNPVDFEFVGVKAMRSLDPDCGPDEVWYDIREILMPMERKDAILPTDDDLLNGC